MYYNGYGNTERWFRQLFNIRGLYNLPLGISFAFKPPHEHPLNAKKEFPTSNPGRVKKRCAVVHTADRTSTNFVATSTRTKEESNQRLTTGKLLAVQNKVCQPWITLESLWRDGYRPTRSRVLAFEDGRALQSAKARKGVGNVAQN